MRLPLPNKVPGDFNARKARSAGFSLIEIIIALGILSFAILTILGLIPTGLATLRESINQTVETQIVNSISGQLAVANFTNLAATDLYFDDEGQSTVEPNTAIYTVNISTNSPNFPGCTNAANLANSLTSSKVEIVFKPAPSAAPGTWKTNFYTLQVANTGK